MFKILICLLVTSISFGQSSLLYDNIINKLNTYQTDKDLVDETLKYVFQFADEQKNIKNFNLFKEKESHYKRSEYRREILKFTKGYLGAFFNSDIKKDPYAYAFILNHSKGKVLRDYIKHNELSKRKANFKKGDLSKIFFSNYHNIIKTNHNTYQVLIKYSIDSYKNFKKEKTIKASSKIQIEIDSERTNFYPSITELKSNYRQ